MAESPLTGQGSAIRQPSKKSSAQQRRQRIYDKRISPVLFAGAKPNANPTIIFLVGQAGAGKSGLSKAQEDRLGSSGSTVLIDPDDLRKYNRDYHPNIRSNSRTAAGKAEVGDWTQEAFLEAVVRRTNIILDGTGANTKRVEERIAYAHAAGYKVEMHAVAARGIDSWLGVLKRHEEAKALDIKYPQAEPQARYVPKPVHDEHARDLLTTLGRVEQLGLCDRITIWQRGAFDTPLYDNQNARLGKTQGAVQTLVAERNRPHTEKEVSMRRLAAQRIDALMEARNAPSLERNEVQLLAVQEHNHGFKRTAARACANLKPEVPVDIYLKDQQAQQRYAKQARRYVFWHLFEREKQGAPPERVAAMGARLFNRLKNPALGFGIKEGLELAVLRRQMAEAPSPQLVQAYYDKRERLIVDLMRARNAHGAGRQRTRAQVQHADIKISWSELEYTRTAALRRQAHNGKLVVTPQPDTDQVLEEARQNTQARMQQHKKKTSKTAAVKKQPKQNGMRPGQI